MALPRAWLAAVPALPEPALHDLWRHRHVREPDAVFRWSLYLLLASVAAHRLLEWASVRFESLDGGDGRRDRTLPRLRRRHRYETKAYVWVGYGVWTQLWASWTLPLAWGFTYRALSSMRSAFFAVLFIMVTVALHFETGYLAFVPLVVWPFIVPSDLGRRLGRAVAIGAAAVLASAWVIVPLLQQSHWAARNQVLEGTGLENGYGAGQMLSWLFTGNLYDNGPVAGRDDPVGCRPGRLHRALARLRRRSRPRRDLGRHARHDVRANDVRIALRHPPGKQRHLHQTLRNGRPPVRHPPGRFGTVFLGQLVLPAPCSALPSRSSRWATHPRGGAWSPV